MTSSTAFADAPAHTPLRGVKGVVRGAPFNWVGDGFRVSNFFPSTNRISADVSPFLLLDYGAPWKFTPTNERRGVGAHPHRGFETVTIAYQGAVAHKDSAGNAGVIRPGDVQWMTAGSGVLHNEFHAEEFARSGGLMQMVQLWVNLPATRKMTDPRYQELTSASIPTVTLDGDAGTARVIAGDFGGVQGPALTHTPLKLVDLKLAAGGSLRFDLPADWNGALLVQAGEVTVNGAVAGANELAVLAREAGEIVLTAGEESRVLLLAGEPIDEPIVFHGPFVMNTRDEIVQAMRDFQAGKFGELED